MKVDTLKGLETAFGEWRRGKKYAREPMPKELVARARRAAKKYGLTPVVRVTRVERARLFRAAPADRARGGKTRGEPRVTKGSPGAVAAFSRLELSAPLDSEPKVRALAEVETATGVRLRVFEGTPEMLSLLSAACGFGGVR